MSCGRGSPGHRASSSRTLASSSERPGGFRGVGGLEGRRLLLRSSGASERLPSGSSSFEGWCSRHERRAAELSQVIRDRCRDAAHVSRECTVSCCGVDSDLELALKAAV